MREKMYEQYNDQIEGRNAVLEYLKSDRDINKILIANLVQETIQE